MKINPYLNFNAPPEDQFWSDYYGSSTDKFGVNIENQL